MLPKTTEYALRATVWLGQTPDKIHSAERLAEAIRVPRRYLHKVLQDLVKGGLVRSQPGPGGGYALDVAPAQFSILDVINAVTPIERIRSCPLNLKTHTELCPLHRELDKAYAAIETALSRVSVAELIKAPNSIAPLCKVASANCTPSE